MTSEVARRVGGTVIASDGNSPARSPPTKSLRQCLAYCADVAKYDSEHVTKSFGEGTDAVKAVDDVSIDVASPDL